MKFQTVEAFCFSGTAASVSEAQDWVSQHDLENVEVTSQGEAEPYALDVIDSFGLKTLEAGDFLYVQGGELRAEKATSFLAAFEREET